MCEEYQRSAGHATYALLGGEGMSHQSGLLARYPNMLLLMLNPGKNAQIRERS